MDSEGMMVEIDETEIEERPVLPEEAEALKRCISVLETFLREATGLVRKYAPLVDVSRFERALGKEGF